MTARPLNEILGELTEALQGTSGDAEGDLETVLRGLYTVDNRLEQLVRELEPHATAPTAATRSVAGPLLERVSYVAFKGLAGFPSISAFRSATSQHDLLVSGDGGGWQALCTLARIDPTKRGILVEAKAQATAKVGDPEMRRLCSIAREHFERTVGLGVFMSLKGATGYSSHGAEVHKIGGARLTQVIHYARTNVPIVVLDWDDIKTLTQSGSLPLLLKRRIADLERMGPTTPPGGFACEAVTLPGHLLDLG